MSDLAARLLVAAAAVVACALITAGAFWALDLMVGDMPSPWWGAVGGAMLAIASYLRTGWAARRPPP